MTSDLTRVLREIQGKDPAAAAARLWPLVYEELRALAARRLLAERPGATLQATALVHEVFLRVAGESPARFDGAAHFFSAAAEAMRRILVERARARGAQKRGGGRLRVELDASALSVDSVPDEILDLDAALDKLAAEDPRKARLVELRFFAGLSLAEAAAALSISPATADRDWAYARAFLFAELDSGDHSERG